MTSTAIYQSVPLEGRTHKISETSVDGNTACFATSDLGFPAPREHIPARACCGLTHRDLYSCGTATSDLRLERMDKRHIGALKIMERLFNSIFWLQLCLLRFDLFGCHHMFMSCKGSETWLRRSIQDLLQWSWDRNRANRNNRPTLENTIDCQPWCLTLIFHDISMSNSDCQPWCPLAEIDWQKIDAVDTHFSVSSRKLMLCHGHPCGAPAAGSSGGVGTWSTHMAPLQGWEIIFYLPQTVP